MSLPDKNKKENKKDKKHKKDKSVSIASIFRINISKGAHFCHWPTLAWQERKFKRETFVF